MEIPLNLLSIRPSTLTEVVTQAVEEVKTEVVSEEDITTKIKAETFLNSLVSKLVVALLLRMIKVQLARSVASTYIRLISVTNTLISPLNLRK